jgi:ribosomal protein L22
VGVQRPALAAQRYVDDPQLRVTEHDARTALRAVLGQPVIAARARLRFGPGRTCEPIARLLDRAIVRAEAAGLDPRLLVVADGHAQAGEDIVRVRRKAHGVADWIRSPTCQVRIVLRPAGLHASVPPAASGPAPAPAAPPPHPGRLPLLDSLARLERSRRLVLRPLPSVTRWPRSLIPTSASAWWTWASSAPSPSRTGPRSSP